MTRTKATGEPSSANRNENGNAGPWSYDFNHVLNEELDRFESTRNDDASVK